MNSDTREWFYSFILSLCGCCISTEQWEENLDLANRLLYTLLCRDVKSADLIRSMIQVKDRQEKQKENLSSHVTVFDEIL